MLFYEEILRALQKHDVRYLILGGAAVNLHGVPRMTADLDIAVDLSRENVESLIAAMKETRMKVSLPLDPRGLADPRQRKIWKEEKNMAALTFQSSNDKMPFREVDVILETPLDFSDMYSEKARLEVDDLKVDVVSLKHLIMIKKGLGRQQDLSDVSALEKVEEEIGRSE